MRRRRVFLIALTAFTVLLVAIGLWRRQAWLQVVAANTAKAETLKSAIDGRFPPGALETDVVEALKSEHAGYVTWLASNWTEYGLAVGDEPSVGAETAFSSHELNNPHCQGLPAV